MLAVLRSYFFKMDIDEFTRIKVLEKEITNGQKENNFYESILIYMSYIEEKINKILNNKENINEKLKGARDKFRPQKKAGEQIKEIVEEILKI